MKQRLYKIIRQMFLLMVMSCLMYSFSCSVWAVGEGNVDGGGNGDLGDASSAQNQWIPGDEGVRVTIVDSATGTTMFTPIDLSRKSHEGKEIKHFKKQCKLTYIKGVGVQPSPDDYKEKTPTIPLPIIISSASLGQSDPAAIKSYFTDNGTLEYIAGLAGITFDELTSGDYKIVIEPIMYFTFQGMYCAMTAHEFFLMDCMQGGAMRVYFKTLAYKNLAYSMFLEDGELGVGAWPKEEKGTSNVAEILDALEYLGIGIIRFKEDNTPDESFDISTDPYVYRTNTDVITSITVYSDVDITPEDPMEVVFYIAGNSYRVSDIVLPAGESQVVWCKWHTPDTPQNITGYAEISGRSNEVTIPITIEELRENEPPDPWATDEKGNWTSNNAKFALTQRYDSMFNTLSWGKWVAIAHTQREALNSETGEWEVVDDDTALDEETYEDERTEIYYTYEENRYYASVWCTFKLTADIRCPTATNNRKRMGSGYGVEAEISVSIGGINGYDMVTSGQNCLFYFPEFYYKDYWRVGELTELWAKASVLNFKNNKYSHFSVEGISRVHFTPLWYPDGENNYEVYVNVFDAWTPVGMIECQETDYVSIKGTVYDDWHIGPVFD